MTALNLKNTVGDFVVERPGRARLFESLGIDYCCGGKTPLAEACASKGLDPRDVLHALDLDARGADGAQADPSRMTLAELADHIEQTHHLRLKHELPRLAVLVEKVARVHEEVYPWAGELKETFTALQAEMTAHMEKEERVFFPLIRQLESGAIASPGMRVGIETPVHCLEAEHESAGRALETMRRLTLGFTPPDGACNTTRAMLGGLADLESDLHLHVHKENNILFPKAVELGRSRAVAAGATQGATHG